MKTQAIHLSSKDRRVTKVIKVTSIRTVDCGSALTGKLLTTAEVTHMINANTCEVIKS